MSKKFYIKDPNGTLLSGDGSVRYSCLEGRALYKFLQTEDGKRRKFHIEVEDNGDEMGIEVDIDYPAELSEQRERDRYLKKVVAKLHITFVSANTIVSTQGEDEIELIETLAGEDDPMEAAALRSIDLETLRNALKTLSPEEYQVIYQLFLAKEPVSESVLAKRLGISQQAVSKKKKAIIAKLAKNFSKNPVVG